MAFMDNTLAFSSNWSTPQAVSTATNVDSTNVVDLTGAGVGNAPAMINGFPQTNTHIGFDIGAGDGVAIPYLYVTVTTTGTSANTFQVNLEAAADNGSYSPGTYYTLYSSAAIAANTLTAGSSLIVPVPPTLFNWPYGVEKPPRFYKLNYVASAALTISVLAGLMLNPPSTLLLGQYNNNFVVV